MLSLMIRPPPIDGHVVPPQGAEEQVRLAFGGFDLRQELQNGGVLGDRESEPLVDQGRAMGLDPRPLPVQFRRFCVLVSMASSCLQGSCC